MDGMDGLDGMDGMDRIGGQTAQLPQRRRNPSGGVLWMLPKILQSSNGAGSGSSSF